MLALEAETQAFSGHLRNAHELTRRAVESALRVNHKAAASIWELQGVTREQLFGDPRVRERVVAAVNLAPQNPDTQELGAVLLARAGDIGAAESMAGELQKRFPSHTMVRSYWLPAIRAQMALVNHQPEEAIRWLQGARSYELGMPLSTEGWVCLNPVYLRGEAYLAAGQGSAAAGEFQRLLEHPGIVWNCPTGAL